MAIFAVADNLRPKSNISDDMAQVDQGAVTAKEKKAKNRNHSDGLSLAVVSNLTCRT